MAVNLSPLGGVAAQFFDNSGYPLTGGKLYSYVAGTTTNATTYTSSNGAAAHSNPIILDAAGRVPSGGEIWLTDGITYKFVLKTSTDTLIATYDNISGINSNFVSYTSQQSIQTATAGQTVFTLPISYQPATNSLSVFVDGVNQYGPGAQYAYVETDANTVTFTSGLHLDAEVKFTTTQQQNAGVADASQVTYDPPFTGAVVTNVEAKLAQTVSVKDFGAVGDGIADDIDAIEAAIASFPTTLDTPYDSYAGTVWFPPGVYYCSRTLEISSQVILIGATAPDGNEPGASRLLFADNIDGVILREYRTSIDGKDSAGSVIQNLAVINKKDAGGASGSGVFMQTRAQLRSCYIANFREHGVKIVADSASNTGNANCWHIDQLRTVGNTLDGVYCHGGDTNAGVGIRIDASNNGRCGIYDSSFLGNTWIACHTSGNGSNSYKVDGLNSNSVFLGCYDEPGYTAPSFTSATNVFGGVLSNYSSSSAQRIGNGTVSGINTTNGTATFLAGINQNISDAAWTFKPAGSINVNRVTYATGRWYWQQDNYGPATYMNIYDSSATVANGYARELPNGGIGFPSGYYAGDYDVQKYRGLGAAAPVTGVWSQGDIVYNSAPSAGGVIGWVCVTGGTPGTWKTFGAISA